tara:strand:+ start:1124 stop:1354 length:231 start_codon:yes stop_codon:yes gene_type:complete
MDRGYVPSAEEFNRKMHECVEYQKLKKLKEHLKWFKGKVAGMNIDKLNKVIDKRINDIPKESIGFDTEVHGQTTNI